MNEKQVSFGSLKLGDYFADRSTSKSMYIIFKKINGSKAVLVKHVGYGSDAKGVGDAYRFGIPTTVYVDTDKFKDLMKSKLGIKENIIEQQLSGI